MDIVRRVSIFVPCAWLVGLAACSQSPATTDASSADSAQDASSDAAADVEVSTDASMAGAMGQPCTVGDDSTCASGLFCLVGPSGGSTGFCTKTCPATSSGACNGTPPGTRAFCVVTDVDAQGDKGCAFVCRVGAMTWTCPGALQCETTEDPPGTGQYLCLP